MSTAISTLGGVGLFLLGMTVMTEGLKTLAGSALRGVLGKAASTPLLGSFWGAIVTLLVQSSSATTMTTIGLVSAGLLTFQQGLSLVFGANIGTTGTGWLVALIGVRVSLTAAALPMIFVGALTKLLGRGRVSGAGAALAGFGLVLFGLTTLQQGMGGLAERLHPADLPAVLGSPGTSWWSGLLGVLALVVIGLVMTALMQSSTAAIAVTLSGYFAGAIGLDQACALIIGQNIGTATSSALAAIGASATAKRLAIAYVLFKLIAALIALVAFPVVTPLLLRASDTIDGVTLLAGYHTAFNVVGVAVLLPLINPFTRLVERILPERGSPLTRCLDPSALETPIVAVEAVRRTIARVLLTVCGSVEAKLAARAAPIRLGKDTVSVQEAADAVSQAQIFLSDVAGPPDTDDEQRRLTSTLHALDHASRLTDLASGGNNFGSVAGGPEDIRAGELCAEVMRSAAAIARGVAAPPRGSTHFAPASHAGDILAGPRADPPDEAIAEFERCTTQLREMLRIHRSATLGAVANGTLTADSALLRVEAVRNLEALSQHAWRSAIHLIGRG
ncbi:Na/Pi symporter [Bradyrhizobium barranii]|jgi:phosphate:Na+ symporter|uniref:Na/Pi symporter n=1 Tax=Bradyrhizobium barranii TaxID=2992140 RepID=A0ABY3QFD0_9BRAD|nr:MULTISPECIES: Na/Pi symporter [Bradyrhizobium]UFW84354.1 Na/Pi symporter [Bradyrhizobium japonicum]CUU17009.1 Sodiumdependent phosphate transporter CDS [Bradyrhizobium sp.]